MQFKAICNRESASASLPLFGTAHCKKRLTLWPGKSIFLAMKLTAILATVFVLHVSARAISQTISFAGKDIPLVKAFEAIKSQTGYVYFCDAAILADAKPITVVATKLPLENFLNEILQGQSLEYTIENKAIIITRKKGATPVP